MLNVLKTNDIYALSGQITWYVNSISTQQCLKKHILCMGET